MLFIFSLHYISGGVLWVCCHVSKCHSNETKKIKKLQEQIDTNEQIAAHQIKIDKQRVVREKRHFRRSGRITLVTRFAQVSAYFRNYRSWIGREQSMEIITGKSSQRYPKCSAHNYYLLKFGYHCAARGPFEALKRFPVFVTRNVSIHVFCDFSTRLPTTSKISQPVNHLSRVLSSPLLHIARSWR